MFYLLLTMSNIDKINSNLNFNYPINTNQKPRSETAFISRNRISTLIKKLEPFSSIENNKNEPIKFSALDKNLTSPNTKRTITKLNNHLIENQAQPLQFKSEVSAKEINPKKNYLPNFVKLIKKLDQRQIKVIEQKDNSFKEGDLFYGLSTPRLKMMQEKIKNVEEILYQNQENLSSENKSFVLLDTINNQFLGTGYSHQVKSKQELSSLSKQEESNFYIKSHTYEGEKSNEHHEVKNFREFLENHDRYDPRKIANSDDIDKRIGKACKGGLEYITKIKKQQIHFVIDGLDVQKVMADLKNAKDHRSITGKEIKWLYRHRNDQKIMNHVIFYEKSQPTETPWIKEPELWKTYDIYRKNKRRGSFFKNRRSTI